MDESKTMDGQSIVVTAFFQRVDWAAFGVTTALAGMVYWLTLAPELDLEYSGIFATSALYPGVSEPPGHPLWTFYGWVFTKIWPFGNLARRLAIGSSLAGAVTCGLIALIVSRMGWLAVESLAGGHSLPRRIWPWLRVVCGVVAGLACSLDRCFWRQAVVPEAWTLTLLLLLLILCLTTRWMFETSKRHYLYVAAWLGGLMLSESQSLVPAVLGLPFMIAAADRQLGRDLLFLGSLILGGIYAMGSYYSWQGEMLIEFESLKSWLAEASLLTAILILGMVWHTRGLLGEWKSTSICVAMLGMGLATYLLLPLYSLTNPPMNWGYTRTVAGFFHVVSMGQFEAIQPTDNLRRLMMQLGLYFQSVRDDLGGIYLLTALIPLAFLHRMKAPLQRWLAGLVVYGLILGLLTLAGLNPDRTTVIYALPYFAASHVVIVLLAGCGLMMTGAWFIGPQADEATQPNRRFQ